MNGTAWYNAQPDGVVYLNGYALTYKGEMPENTTIEFAPGTKGTFYCAFQNQKNITSVIINDSMEFIEKSTFSGCSGIKTVEFGSGLKRIGEEAFQQCEALEAIDIPATVESVERAVFNLCYKVRSIKINGPTIFGNGVFIHCGRDVDEMTLTIAEGVEEITYMMFGSCSSLKSIVLPSSIVTLGTQAFQYCSSLESVTIPGVEKVDRNVFLNCTSLTEVNLGNGVKMIGAGMFRGCTSLTSLTIPSSVTKIDSQFVDNCTSLTSITFNCTLEEIREYAIDTILLKRCSNDLVIYYEGGSFKPYHAAVEPTCTENGSIEYWENIVTGDCYSSNSYLDSEKLSPEDIIIVASCKDTDKDHECDVCHNAVGVHTPAGDNTHICEYCGQSASEHTGGTATCTEKATCDICGEEYGDPLGHDWKDGVCTRCSTEQPYKRYGKRIYFGSYPQTKVTDDSLLSILNGLAGTLPTSENSESWTAYEGYYMGGKHYMWYIDVESGGERYRGVYFTSYRPSATNNMSNKDSSNQDENGYDPENVYWFKFEPIAWTVLNESDGSALILCNMIIDSQQYDGEGAYYDNNYADSTIRAWLNDMFYNSAFTKLQQSIILTTEVDNSASSTGKSENPYACDNTNDNVFLLSYTEASTYLTSDEARLRKTTDYAKSQGVINNSASNGYWWLRSPYDGNTGWACRVYYDGSVSGYSSACVTDTGIVPALVIQLDSSITGECGHEGGTATCTEKATCDLCGEEYGDPLGHDWADATCTAPKTCNRCKLTDGKALGHDWADATCTEPKTCKTCSETDGDALGHDWTGSICSKCNLNRYFTRDGNKISFGTYPQSKVTDESLLSALNGLAGTLPTSESNEKWTSYGYYLNGSVQNFMWYIDVENGGERYRGVYFTSYIPMYGSQTSTPNDTMQYKNNYNTGNVYWFKFEPISWTILSENGENALILCDLVIDAHAWDYDGKEHINNYAESTIRAWLNETFYNTAFNELQQSIILVTEVDNSAASTGDNSNSDACDNTYDKIFMLSYQEATTYFTSAKDLIKTSSDYARSQGVSMARDDDESYGNAGWHLRSPYVNGSNKNQHWQIGAGGSPYKTYVGFTGNGVVPALRIRLNGAAT